MKKKIPSIKKRIIKKKNEKQTCVDSKKKKGNNVFSVEWNIVWETRPHYNGSSIRTGRLILIICALKLLLLSIVFTEDLNSASFIVNTP